MFLCSGMNENPPSNAQARLGACNRSKNQRFHCPCGVALRFFCHTFCTSHICSTLFFQLVSLIFKGQLKK
jgi:hypothetical protein